MVESCGEIGSDSFYWPDISAENDREMEWNDHKVRLLDQDSFAQRAHLIAQHKWPLVDWKHSKHNDEKYDYKQEAQEHYDRATRHLAEATLASMIAAGLLVEMPPAGIASGYIAVDCWKEAAKEYNAGKEVERRGKNDD